MDLYSWTFHASYAGRQMAWYALKNESHFQANMLSGSPDDSINDCNKICPNAISNHSVWLWLLASAYFILSMLSIFLLFHRVKSFKTLHLTSFRSTFLILAFSFSTLRAILTTFQFSWTLFSLIFVGYLLPIFFQFATFSLLIVFLAKCQYMIQGRDVMVRRRLYPVYITSIVLFFLVSIALGVGFSYLVNPNSTDTISEGFDQKASIYSTSVFTTLFLLVIVYGYRTHTMLNMIVLSKKKQKKAQRFSYITAMYLSILFARVCWDVTYIAGINKAQQAMNDMINDDDTNYFIVYFVFYMIVEIVPTSVLLISFLVWLPRPKTNDFYENDTGALYSPPVYNGDYNTFSSNNDEREETD